MAQRLLMRNTHFSACHWPQKSLKASFPHGRRNAFPASTVSASDGEGFAWTASQCVLKSSCSVMFWRALWLHGVWGCTNPTRDCWSCLSLSPPSTAFAKCCKRGDPQVCRVMVMCTSPPDVQTDICKVRTSLFGWVAPFRR